MTAALADLDFAFDEMPGAILHENLHALRSAHPVHPARFMGLPAFVITGYEALLSAFTDDDRFPGHLMYKSSLEPVAGG